MGVRGVTLIELMAAVVLVTFVVSGMSLFMPRASKAAVTNRYLATAKNMATGKIQELKQKPYAYIAPTPLVGPLSFAFPYSVANGLLCDCSQENPDGFPSDPNTDVLVDNGVTFTRRTCINLVKRASGAGSTWQADCLAADGSNDTGLKNIRVRVTYPFGGTTKSVDAESLVSR